MFTLYVSYLGKNYDLTGPDSIDVVEQLERRFGRIVERRSTEGYTYYRTARNAEAWLNH